MTALRFSGPVLPDGEVADLYVVDGHVTYEPQPGAETAAEGWIVPGLVDAHCHIGLDDHGPVTDAEAEEQAIADRDGGALLIRDCGSALDTAWMHEREDLPRLIRAGRHVARTRRYIRGYAHEVEPQDLAARVAEEARRGDGWVKLVGDWIDRETGDLAPSFDPPSFAAAIAAAHEQGAKVTAHCFGHDVLAGLLDAGIDCIEHGTGLTPELVERMVAAGTALVPTVMQLDKFPEHARGGAARFPAYAATMTDLHVRRRDTLMGAFEAGVPLYAGSDGGGVARHGNLVGEVVALAALGLPAHDALGAASWRARDWLGWNATLEEGAPADFVVTGADPLADLSTLFAPRAVVLRGRVVAGVR
ncbi:imidazolonepropionase-like amidohydrolase [Nocardioides zeae]|uniref:Imidazolonepropionase-like amidohydrolase n=1 Tax=Nocardioides zeae TaxID=1457234 RepID=A0ACC6IHS1_9ACTN|nr:amidohydrolase family protein [Nocardioides zeae]MDR6173170.1 imidazolonepropionase-like amidohydrolase [Nocardioides zeae]MDR6210163.1 imidazolonepropionase-like amidohydrolase [Nocardioides zeae]